MIKQSFRYALYLFVAIGFSSARADAMVDFFRAVPLDDARTVTQLLARGFDPNTVNEKGQSGLFLALRENAPRVTEALLAHPQTRIDAPNASDETPLMMAALRGHVDWAEKLLDKGAALNRPGWTALHYAATGPETRVVALLLARGAAIEAVSPNRTTPLMMASRYGPESSVDLLLQRGARLDARNDQGLGPADFATLGGREALARRLGQMPR